MKITANTWQANISQSLYKTNLSPEKTSITDTVESMPDTQNAPAENAIFQKNSKKDQDQGLFQSTSSSNNNSSSKIKASVPDDSVGQLASELANGHTKLDVLQVSSKAMRAMASLRMSGAISEGKDKEKINQMIRRMNRLLKRIRTKLRNLEKEEQLEKQQAKAEKKKEEQKARALSSELRNKRNRRRREEQDYARKELTNSNRNGSETPLPAVPGTNAGASLQAASSQISELSQAAVSVSAPVSTDMAISAESISVDITV